MSRCGRVAVPLSFVSSLALVGAACSEQEEAHTAHAEHRDLPAELPRIPSKLLDYQIHSGIEREARNLIALTGPRRLEQKVLLLTATGDEPAFQAAKDALQRIGIPYQAVLAVNQEVTDAMLTDGVSTCRFSAVLISTSGLGYFNALTGAWESALTPEEWTRLANFEVACSAREAVWFAWPSAELGLAYQYSFTSDDSVDATIADPSFFRRVPSGAHIPYRHSAGYGASIVDPTKTRALLTDAGGRVLLAQHNTPDGRELLVSTVDSNPYLAHAVTLEYDMLRWLTRGLFVGQKRAYAAPQIDDLFIDNDMWIIGVGNNATVQFRVDGGDFGAFVNWEQGFRARLPAGSTFVSTMAFNGVGTVAGEYPDATLLNVARANRQKVGWLNHTWDHENLDAMTRAATRDEVDRNCRKARDLKFPGFNCNELVTPDMSGLTNPAAVAGMLDAGVRWVVSDTSITEALRPNNPGTNPSFNVGRFSPIDNRLYQIPRHPTNIFYDISSPETATDEYNFIYRSFWGRDLTYTEMLDKASEFSLFYLLQGDIDPLMFHQANIADYAGGKSVYGDFFDAVATKYLALHNAPVLTLGQNEIGQAMKARARLDACNPRATIVESATGRSLLVQSSAACVVPVTGIAAAGGTVSNYAGEATTSFTMPAGGGSVTVPLL
jgi:hypothetical protein